MNPTQIKNPFASKTLWGAVFTLVSLVGRAFHVDVPVDDIKSFVDLLGDNWENISQGISIILVIWGRFTATKAVSF